MLQRNTREMNVTSGSYNDDNSSTTSEDIASSHKRLNHKRTPPANAAVPTRKSTRNRQTHSEIQSQLTQLTTPTTKRIHHCNSKLTRNQANSKQKIGQA